MMMNACVFQVPCAFQVAVKAISHEILLAMKAASSLSWLSLKSFFFRIEVDFSEFLKLLKFQVQVDSELRFEGPLTLAEFGLSFAKSVGFADSD